MNHNEILATSRLYDVEFFRRSNQGLSLTLGRNSPLQDVYNGSSHPNRESTPPNQLEVKTSGTQRKRVPVACERCRKRKIKCSGDEGDGRGCVNCKNAGWDGCQFLRVQSWNTQVNPSSAGGRHWQHRYHPYPSNRLATHILNPQSYVPQTLVPFPTWQHGLEVGQCPSSTESPSWSRMHFNPTCSIYEPESMSPYSSQPPSYMLPDHEHTSSTNIAHPSGFNRTQSSMLWLDQMNGVSIPQQNHQMVSSLYPLTPAESHKSFRGLCTSASQGVSIERTLPTPAVSRSLQSTSPMNRYTPPLSAFTHRSSNGWQSETASNVSQSSSRNSCSEGAPFTDPRSPLNPSLPETTFPYTATAQSPQIHTPASALPAAPETCHIMLPSQASETRKIRCRASRDSIRSSSPGTTPLGYSYTSAMTNSRRLHATKTTRSLANGTPYMWNPPAPSRSEASADQDENDHLEPQTASNRASAASLGTSSIY